MAASADETGVVPRWLRLVEFSQQFQPGVNDHDEIKRLSLPFFVSSPPIHLCQPVDIIATEKIFSDGMFCAEYRVMRRDALMVPEVYNLLPRRREQR
jgi:hypothetical protein